MTAKTTAAVCAAFALVLAMPAVARAQSAIAGVVRDASGTTLSDVRVEAASPALIERSRIAVTDGSGQYKIIDLRPGVYTLSFQLPGFQTVTRVGLELPSDFTATIDTTLKVGAREESVTISGSSPVVDVQNNLRAQVLSRDVLDDVPNAHTIQSVGQLIPGVSLTAPDVGGSQAMQQTYFSVHGSAAAGTSVLMDGMIINGLQLDGAVQSYLNDAGSQEMVYTTGGGGSDSPTGGVRMNLVPREGGNSFSGSLFLGVENWQSDNFSQDLKNSGVTSVDQIGTYHDVDLTEGGPIKRDRLWFFGSGRLFTVNKPIASTFVSDPSLVGNPNASFANLAACRSLATSCAQGVDDQTINSGLAHLTLQVSPRNKLSAYLDRIHKDRAHAMVPGDDQTTTSVHWTSPLYLTSTVKWTTTVNGRWLIEGGWSSNVERYNNLYQPGIEQQVGSALWFAMASRQDTTANQRSVAGAPEYGSFPDRYNWQASASYVTGAHNIKLGFQDSYGPYNQKYTANADLTAQYQTLNGVPSVPYQVTIYASNPVFQDRLNAALGVYAQDSWTMRRLTLNAGLRWDYLNEQVTGQAQQAGTFAVIPEFGDIQMPTQTTWSPRVSLVLDLFGDGKTALRAGFNRFPNAATTGLAAGQDPANGANITALLPWSDVNGDNIVQYSVTHAPVTGQLISTCTFGTTGCEINFASLPVNFGQTTLTNHIDANLKRPYQDQINLGIQRELAHGVSVTLEWFRAENKDAQTTQNLNRQAPAGVTDATLNPNFRAVTVFSPIDGRAITVYDVASAAISVAAPNNQVFTDPNQTSGYNGFDFGINARLPGGARLFGGSTTERTVANTCDLAVYNPNNILYCDTSSVGIPWRTQFKLSGTYPLGKGFTLSGAYQALPGYVEGNTTYPITKITNYTVCPGSSAAQGCLVNAKISPTQVTSSISVPLDAAGTTLTPRTNQVDIGLAKRFLFGRVRVSPKVDVFNALNSDAYFTVRSTVFSPIVGPSGTSAPALPALATGSNFTNFRAAGSVLQGRILRVGANVTW
jgi:hypothetical protein